MQDLHENPSTFRIRSAPSTFNLRTFYSDRTYCWDFMAAFGTGSGWEWNLWRLCSAWQPHAKNKVAREAIASALDAFLETVEHIEDCYKKIEAKPATNQAQFYKLVQKARGYPYKTSYHYEWRKVTITYDETKLIFSANFGKNRFSSLHISTQKTSIAYLKSMKQPLSFENVVVFRVAGSRSS